MDPVEMELAEAVQILATANATMREQRQEIASLKERIKELEASGLPEMEKRMRQAEARATSAEHMLRVSDNMARRLQREVDSRDARIDELFRLTRNHMHIRNANIGAVDNSPDYSRPIITSKSKAKPATKEA